MSTKAWIIFAAICVVVFGGLIVWSGKDRVDVSKVDTNAIQTAATVSGNIGDHTFGNEKAKVVLVEYGDFQCPACGSAHPTVRKLTEKYKDQMLFVFRNFPLTQIHPNARAGAAAVEAAGLKGKYWEMHNLLFESQGDWTEASATDRGAIFSAFAEKAGIKKADFNTTLKNESARINKKIDFDRAIGGKLKVDSTPTFYLNGKKLESKSYNGEEAFEKTLLEAFKQQGVKIPESTESAS